MEPPPLPLDAFVTEGGLEVTVWAASPALFNPTNMDIDAAGRIWVTEGVNYRRFANRQPQGDRIVVMEDRDKDGKADLSQTFWQDPELVSPLGIAVFDNVVVVSQPPHLIKLTDTNRDLRFNLADGDVREVLLTGFNGRNHDHSLHSVTAAPDGSWVFNQGNAGAIFTDRSGKTFRIGSAYYQLGGGEWPFDTKAISGKPSDDGFVYVGGFAARMQPDGTQAEIIGHNFRNSYEQTITSRGSVFQNDNDDPPACRTTYMLEYGNAGFASPDGLIGWAAERRAGQSIPTAEWRQDDPGVMPSGDVYGGGSPTGIAFYENGALGEAFEGTLLSCEAARNVIFAYKPVPGGAGYTMDRRDFMTSNREQEFIGADFTRSDRKISEVKADESARVSFRPADVCVGPDGALYVADWTDLRVGGHDTFDEAASGVIYRIAPKGFKPEVPAIDLTKLDGAVRALESPAVNVRFLGFRKLQAAGAEAWPHVEQVLANRNPWIAARAIWLLPYLGDPAIKALEKLLEHADAEVRLTAFRAIRRSGGRMEALPFARKLAQDASPLVRAEAALAMRFLPLEQSRDVLLDVAARFDGSDRTYLEALGLGTGKNQAAFWKILLEKQPPAEQAAWTDSFARITWRMMPEEAIDALKARAIDASLTEKQRALAIDSLAFISSPASAAALMDIAAGDSPTAKLAKDWIASRSEGRWASMNLRPELLKRGLVLTEQPLVQFTIPPKPTSQSFSTEDVLKLKGDRDRGKLLAARCAMCHQIDEMGVEFGPSLKGFGSRQAAEVLAKAIVDPSADIAHGFQGISIKVEGEKWIDGLPISDGDPLVIRSMGGLNQRVPLAIIKERYAIDRSLMLSADQLGLKAQDVADIIEWMKYY